MKEGYDPVADQAALTSLFDIQQAMAIPSFKRLAARLATYFEA